jgi:hypothetical protein
LSGQNVQFYCWRSIEWTTKWHTAAKFWADAAAEESERWATQRTLDRKSRMNRRSGQRPQAKMDETWVIRKKR